MVDHKFSPDDVEAMLERWRQGAGADWTPKFRHRLNAHRLSYAASGNPLDAWSALLLAHALGEQPPDWVMEYLAVCAAGFHNLQHAALQGEKIKPKEIARLLGITSKGRGTVFPNLNEWEWIALAGQVRDSIAKRNMETYAIEGVADWNDVSDSKVRRAWKRFQSAYPDKNANH